MQLTAVLYLSSFMVTAATDANSHIYKVPYCSDLIRFNVTNIHCEDKSYSPGFCCLHHTGGRSKVYCLPLFAIVGVHKCGTTELQAILSRHEIVSVGHKTEIDFFDSVEYDNRQCKVFEYIMNFPVETIAKDYLGKTFKINTFDKSPSYIREEMYMKRMYDMLPELKIVISLRHPTNQAYSAFRFQCDPKRERKKFRQIVSVSDEKYSIYIDSIYRIETPKFDFATYRDLEQCGKESFHTFLTHNATRIKPRLGLGLEGQPFNITVISPGSAHEYISIYALDFLSYAVYDEQLLNVLKFYPPEQILVVFLEEWTHEIRTVAQEISRFVGLPDYDFSLPKARINEGRIHSIMNPEEKFLLDNYFSNSIRRLRQLIKKYFMRELPHSWLERLH